MTKSVAAPVSRRSIPNHAIGITWWPDKLITIRPELRFDHSYDTRAYNLGRDYNQLAFIIDFIFHF